MSSNMQLIRSITIYGGLPIFIFGTVGNILNMICLWRLRENPCGFIFLVSSFINFLVLFYGLLTRILSVGFNLDWSNTSLTWCKIRIAFTQALFLISLTCICLASIDRFLISCRQRRLRNLSRLLFARLAIAFTIIFWLCHSVPYLIYADLIRNSTTGLTSCSIRQKKFYSIYRMCISFPVYLGLLPTTVLIISGILTYRNTNKLKIIRQRQLIQKKLTMMLFIQIPIITISTVPHILFREYLLISSSKTKPIKQNNIENLFANVFILLFYITFACPFYIFLITSSTFRKDTKLILFYRKKAFFKVHQIEPCVEILSQISMSMINHDK